MRAIRFHEYGGPEVLKLEEVPVPEPATNELLIKVYASGVNPVDWKIRKGLRKEKFPSELPMIPGWDVSGVVEKVGDSVKNFKTGDEVYSRPDLTKNGSYAEYMVIDEGLVNFKPKNYDHVESASIPLAGLTAWQGLFEHGHLEAGQKVLIHAASGGVGSFAVQFAKWKGAYVIGTCSEDHIEFVKKLGADEVIDYKKEDFSEKLKDLNLVFDLLGEETQKKSIKVLKKGGHLITTLNPEYKDEATQKGIHLKGFTAQSYPEDLRQIALLVDVGDVKPVISKVMDLEDAAAAHRLSEAGHVRGKIVLKVV